MTQFLNTALKLNLTNNYEHRFDGARFSVLNETNVLLNAGAGHYAASLKTTESFQFAGRKKVLEIKGSHSEYSGINRKFVTPDGMYDPTLAMEEFTRSGTEKRTIKEDTFALLATHTMVDSHEMFLYNMLCSWLRAYLYSGQEKKDGILRVKTEAYRDSHVMIHIDQAAPEHCYEVELVAPVPAEMVITDDWQFRNSANKWINPYVVKYSATTKRQEYFYLAHLSGRTNASALNTEFNLPGIYRHITSLEPVGGVNTIFDEEPDIDWGNKELMWQWILDYVMLNRLQQQFAAAFESLLTMSVQPCYNTMESTAWQAAPLHLVLPEFCPTRAKISLALEGEPYTPSAGPHDFLFTDGRAPSQCVITAAMTNYYMAVGMYAVLEHTATLVSDWHYAFLLSDQSTEILGTSHSKAACVSVITGREYTTLMYASCCAYIDVKPMQNVDYIEVSQPIDGSITGRIYLRHVPTIVSGGLVNGTTVDTYESCAHLTGLQVVSPRDAFKDQFAYKAILQLSNVYREFGHDTFWEMMPSRADLAPYASVHSCIIDPYSLEYITDRPFCAINMRSVEREGRSATIPPLQTLIDEETIAIRKLRPCLTIVAWNNRYKPLPPVRFIRKAPIVHQFRVHTGATSNTVAMRSTKSLTHQQGFQEGPAMLAPLRPVELEVTHLIPVDTAATSNDV